MGFGMSLRRGSTDPLRARTGTLIGPSSYEGRDREEIDDLLEEDERWLYKRPDDEDVRAASDAATKRRARIFSEAHRRKGD